MPEDCRPCPGPSFEDVLNVIWSYGECQVEVSVFTRRGNRCVLYSKKPSQKISRIPARKEGKDAGGLMTSLRSINLVFGGACSGD